MNQTAKTPVTVLLVDDHPVVLHGLRELLSSYVELRLLGEETDGRRVREVVIALRPDVVVLDLMLPGLNGMEVIAQLSREKPSPRVVVFSMHANAAYIWKALQMGAAGYVLKCAAADELVKAVLHAARGGRYLSAGISEPEVDSYELRAKGAAVDPYGMLTRRERQIFQLVAEGSTSGEIAEMLSLGVRTVETHRANIMRKLNLHNHTELVRYAIRRGVIPT